MLKTRNAVLRQAGDGALDRRWLEDLLAVYDPQLTRLGAQVSAARQAFVSVVQDEFAAAFAAMVVYRRDPRGVARTPTEAEIRVAAERAK